jgi:hypothetical protein
LLTVFLNIILKLYTKNKEMATDYEKNAFKPNLGLGGAAMRKM